MTTQERSSEHPPGFAQDSAAGMSGHGTEPGAALRPEYEDAARYNNFRNALTVLINQHSIENGSDTPDFLLAEYLMSCLDTWERSVTSREEWYGRTVSDWAGAE